MEASKRRPSRLGVAAHDGYLRGRRMADVKLPRSTSGRSRLVWVLVVFLAIGLLCVYWLHFDAPESSVGKLLWVLMWLGYAAAVVVGVVLVERSKRR